MRFGGPQIQLDTRVCWCRRPPNLYIHTYIRIRIQLGYSGIQWDTVDLLRLCEMDRYRIDNTGIHGVIQYTIHGIG